MSILILFFFGLLCISGTIFANPAVKLNSVCEQTIPWPGHGLANPFTDTELALKVQAPIGRPDGSGFDYFGFYDGDGDGGQNGDAWKFRLCLDTPGEWTVQAVFVNPHTGKPAADAPALKPFRYTVMNEAAHPGHIRLEPENGLRYVRANGSAFFPFAFHASSMLCNSMETTKIYIDEHLKRGIDNLTVRFHSEVKNAGLPEQYHWLLKDGGRGREWPGNTNGFDYSRFDLATWHYNEKVISFAMDKGMNLSIWFGISGINRQYKSYGPMDNNGGELGPRQKQFIKYLLARWAAYPNWWHWTINSEWEESKQRELNIAYAKEIQRWCPWSLLITNHSLRDWTLGGTEEGWDLAQLQRRVIDTDEGATACRQFVQVNSKYGLPVFNIEGVWSLSNPVRTRIATMAHLMEGGTSHVAFDGRGQSSSWAVNWEQLNPGHKAGAEAVGQIAKFLNHTTWKDRFNRSVPAHHLVEIEGGHLAMCNARLGDAYFVWADEGGTVTLDLQEDKGNTFDVIRYDLSAVDITGEMLPAVSGGGKVTLAAGPKKGFGNDSFYAVLNTKPDTAFKISTVSLPPAFAGSVYSTRIRVRNGEGKVTWKISTGSLPAGLILTDGQIKGRLEKPETASFEIEARCGKQVSSAAYTLTVQQTDTQAPAVSEIAAVDFGPEGFTLTWKTDEPATSRVQWGPNRENLTGESGENPAMTTRHAVRIQDRFEPGQAVHYLIITSDEAINTQREQGETVVPERSKRN
jgi:hypothetical protein